MTQKTPSGLKYCKLYIIKLVFNQKYETWSVNMAICTEDLLATQKCFASNWEMHET